MLYDDEGFEQERGRENIWSPVLEIAQRAFRNHGFLRSKATLDYLPPPQFFAKATELQDDLVRKSGVKHTTLTKIEGDFIQKPSVQVIAKIAKAFREAAKSNQNYKLTVKNGGVYGRSNSGERIQINNLGKWLFGVSGYRGHVIYGPISATEFRVYYPEGAPIEVVKMLETITGEMVKSKCLYWGNTAYEDHWMATQM